MAGMSSDGVLIIKKAVLLAWFSGADQWSALTGLIVARFSGLDATGVRTQTELVDYCCSCIH